MFIVESINRGEAVVLYGNAPDLSKLYKAIRLLAASLPPGHDEFVLGLAFDVRKALEGQRKKKRFTFGKRNRRTTYFGVDIPWMIILQHLALLKRVAQRPNTSLRSRRILAFLEGAVM